jgi:allene oxide cyclase
MKKTLILCATLALVVGLFAGMMFANLLRNSSSVNANGVTTVHVVEHATSDTVQQWNAKHFSVGDILGFHNVVFDVDNDQQVGQDNGQCTRTVATGKTEWECFWTTFLSGGNITVEGPFFDDGTDTTLTITGGTGIYVEARGSMLLHARGNPLGSEFDFVFRLVD